MHDLRVIGVEGDVLLASASDGSRYRIPIDDEVHALLRRRSAIAPEDRKIAPRDIQLHIRSGMSAREVADMTGAPIEYIEKFEGPVLAEREYVVDAARAVPVSTAGDTDSVLGATFGSVMEERLVELGAAESSWGSWKDPDTGWIVKLSFAAGEVQHDARWQFDPKKSTLVPLNNDATRLSQQGELTESLIPRLRAVPIDRAPDTTRFDSGAFTESDLGPRDTAPYGDAIPFGRGSQGIGSSASQDGSGGESDNTSDLLEALRRRRGEREPSPTADAEPKTAHPTSNAIRVIDIPLDDFNDDDGDSALGSDQAGSSAQQPSLFTPPRATNAPHSSSAPREPEVQDRPMPPKSQRRGRVSMPSWDDIVFGAKADDD